jgi:hypothetical protein
MSKRMTNWLSLFIFFSLVLLSGIVAAQTITTKTFSLTVTQTGSPLIFTTSSLPNGVTNFPYASTRSAVTASGGTLPFVFSIAGGSLPTGLSLASTGVISGTPTSSGVSSFVVQVTDSATPAVSITGNFSITIYGALTITTTSLPSANVAVIYSASIQISGGLGPYACLLSSGALPTGLSLSTSSATCQISGTPAQAGTYSFTILVADSASNLAKIQGEANLYAMR